MKRYLLFVVVFLMFGMPVCAQDSYRIEVLQVSKINPFDWAYEGFVEELARHGIVQGQNLVINRRIIDADADAGLWKKVGILMKIKGAVSDIIASKPDLVLTISSPATKYSKDKLISAGIPVVFTAVAVPQAIGCASVSQAGPGFTGASLYLDPASAFKITKLALPNLTKMGIVHSDDDNAVAFAQEATAKAAALGITILSKEVGKSDSPVAGPELIGRSTASVGTDDYQPSLFIEENRFLLVHCHVGSPEPSSISPIQANRALSGTQAAKILKEGAVPETLPILIQEELTILVDIEASKKVGIELPLEILQIAKEVTAERM